MMQTDHVKTAVAGAWILVVGAVGYLVSATSFPVWAGLALLAVVPPAIMMWLWNAPAQSMSESIRKAIDK